MIRPTMADVMPANRMENPLLTIVFPSSSVHSNKLPFCRIGMIAFAYVCSRSSPAVDRTRNATMSKERSPNVRPEKRADRQTRTTARGMEAASGRSGESSTVVVLVQT